jgi:LysM repeat protein
MSNLSLASAAFNAVPFTVMPYETHTVQRGETLSGIARQHGTTTAELLRANPQIGNPDRLAVGEVLHLPSGRGAPAPFSSPPATHGAQPGETLGQLARDFHTDVATLTRLNHLDNAPQRGITEADYQALADELGVDVAALKAVAQVESRGDGFLASGKPKILFESHVFSRYTDHVYDLDHPGLSAPKWDKSLYGARGEHQWDRLQEAMKLDPEAALKATSWGRFQIMGYNHAAAGYPDVQSFVKAMSSSEAAQLRAFGSFLKSNPAMLEALKNHDWTEFARRYNGAGFAKNHYDEHMRQAYEKLTS